MSSSAAPHRKQIYQVFMQLLGSYLAQLDLCFQILRMRGTLKKSHHRIERPVKPPTPPEEEYCIYDLDKSCSEISEESLQQSSFELEQEQSPPEQDRQNIEKLLDRLGLKTQTSAASRNQQLEIVVNNFVENCIGSVNRTVNTEEYNQLYDAAFQEKIKAKTAVQASIYVSELTELEKLQKLSEKGLLGFYRRLRIVMKYISLTCEKIVGHMLFEAFILLVILLNSIKMATDDPLATTTALPQLETAFTAIYVSEMALKIFAFGFVLGQGAYLRDMWNFMDFIIVVTSLLPLIINLGFSVSALRAIRVLRPLRTITKVRALKMIVRTLFYSFSLVMDSLYILLFVMGVFGIAGMQLFGGNLKFNCMDLSTGRMSGLICGSDSDCSSDQICAKGISSPNYSIINFDTLLWSELSVFQTITTEGWSSIMVNIQQSSGIAYCVYSILIVLICDYVLLNMTLAILKYKYAQVKGNSIQEEEEEKQEYQPEFLKKIGIFKDISVLSKPNPLVRLNNSSKKQVGCQQTLPPEQPCIRVSHAQLLDFLEGPKQTEKIQDEPKQRLDLKELRQIGRLQDYKWDVNNLYFETNQPSEKDLPVQRDNDKPSSDKTLGEKSAEDEMEESFGSDSEEEFYSSESSSEQGNRESEIADKAIEVQKKLNQTQHDLGIAYPTKRLFEEVPEVKKVHKVTKEVSELDRLLSLIGSKPGASHEQQKTIIIPDVDLTGIIPERIYERFGDLGDFGLRRVAKQNELGGLVVARKTGGRRENKRKVAPIQEAIQEAALDIKQLHLKNELEKKALKCRVKADELIDQERHYDLTRVIVSQKVREVEKKKEEIRENMNSLHFRVRYRGSQEHRSKDDGRAQIYTRNLENQKMILKVPEIVMGGGSASSRKEESARELTQQTKGNNEYLKMLQNRQIEEKIELKLDRIMAAFFKKENPAKAKKVRLEETTAEEQYQLIREEDILKRHGHLELQYPVGGEREQTLESMNMKREQYEIHIKGLLGAIRVARKQTLLFASHPAYDNFILVFVLLNTVMMSLNGFVNTDDPPFNYINEAFTMVFIADLAIKVFAYGAGFFGDMMNLFDAGVVAISIVELTMGTSNLSALRSIRILRAFRVLRITRLIRSLSYMRIIMGVVSSIINEFVYVFLLLSLFIFIYTLLGMQIFGGNFPTMAVTGIRQNYDTFFNALFTVFQVMTVENWNDIETMTGVSSLGPWSILFLISWIFLGNWILLNLLQAVLLDGFDDDATDPEQQIAASEESQTAVEETIPILDEQEEKSESSEGVVESKSTKHDLNIDDEDVSLFLFRPSHWLRRASICITSSTCFEVVMFIAILASSAKLALDTYLDDSSPVIMKEFSSIADYVFNFLFICQCLMKVISFGLVVGENSYLSSSWNKLDFFIVCTSILDMVLSNVNLSIIKLLRTLRPLRIITRNEEMRIMVSSLVESLVGIFNVLIICLCVFLMFAILGMNLLQGKLGFCNTGGAELVTGSYGPYNISQTQCESQGGVWATQLINFENVASSMISLYVFSTRENWPFYVYSFIDASESGPVQDNNQVLYFLYAVLFIFVGSLFFMDLLVGVMFMNYHQAEQKIRPKTLSDKQINWQNLQKIIVSEDPCFQLYLCPDHPLRKFFFTLVSGKTFEIMVALVIIVNIIVMSISNDDITAEESDILTQLNSIFSFIFIGELLLKFMAYGRAYFLSVWNVFDFFVVSASILDLILHYSGVSSQSSSALSILPQIARIFRVLRITRLLRMFKSFKGLQKLIETFVFSLPAIGKGLAIMMLYLFIASVLASNLMGGIQRDFGGNLNDILNYRDFHHAIEMLFVNMTGENWYYYMFFSTTEGYVQCMEGQSCVSSLNFLFWLPFMFLGQKVFLQLFVLIVLDQFEANYINENNPLGIFALFQEDFRENWITVTVKYHSEKIEAKKLIDLMLLLRPPLGLGRVDTLKKYEHELQANDKLTRPQIEEKINELDRKLKKNAARLLHKMNVMKNRIYFGYHETFYNFAKLAIVPEFIDLATPTQREALENMHRQSEKALEEVKPAGNLYYYGQLQGQQEMQVPLNPISLILFTQMIVKSWHNYSLKGRGQGDKKDKNEAFDSLNNSCASDISQAKYEKIAVDRKVAMRRGGLIENKLDIGQKNCEFRPTPNMCAAYGEGKRTKHKISIMSKKNRSSGERNSLRRSSRMQDLNRLLKTDHSGQ